MADGTGAATVRLGPAIVARKPVEVLREAFRRTEIFAVDLDECVFPGYTQTVLGARVARAILRRPERGRDRWLLPQMAMGAALYALKEGKRLLGLGTPFRVLVRRYERAMAGVPESTVRAAARTIPGSSYPYAAETVALLAEQALTGLVSQGLDVVVEAFVEQFRCGERPSLGYTECNTVCFRTGPRGRRVFDGYAREGLIESGEGKRRVLERRMAAEGASVASSIGRGDDDVAVAELCAASGGLAIGFNPSARMAAVCDVAVRAADWEPMYALAAILAGQRA